MRQQHQEALTDLRRLIGCQRIYSEAFTRLRCHQLYGRDISDRQWRRWLRRVRAEADPVELGGMSEATHVLLLTLAKLLKGNEPGRAARQVTLARLVYTAEAALQGTPLDSLPDAMSYQELKRLAELQAMRSYTDRYHRTKGLKRSQKVYSRAHATQILSNYPNYSHVYAEAI